MVLLIVAVLFIFVSPSYSLECVKETLLGPCLMDLIQQKISCDVQNITETTKECNVANDFCVTLEFGKLQQMKGCSSDVAIGLLASSCWQKRVKQEPITSMLLDGTKANLTCCDYDLWSDLQQMKGCWSLLSSFLSVLATTTTADKLYNF
ncbi:hypothetical protein QR680_007990 [Steinernema hermaphroditum]|uniref:Uncharacterized protein n=1 Tax=Steinernema hermaphroditum TaxID=289476 RepID=A0AA39IH37_9BILA|nr:hypothetical protein QR680_007990 [Steinernema hermaphroditum]